MSSFAILGMLVQIVFTIDLGDMIYESIETFFKGLLNSTRMQTFNICQEKS